jgi:hypothetical protein
MSRPVCPSVIRPQGYIQAQVTPANPICKKFEFDDDTTPKESSFEDEYYSKKPEKSESDDVVMAERKCNNTNCNNN